MLPYCSNLHRIVFSPLVFLINVVRVLFKKLHPCSSQSAPLALRKAARATLILVPLFGLHNILLPLRPEAGAPMDKFYQLLSALLVSLQVQISTVLFLSLSLCYNYGRGNSDNDTLNIRKKYYCLPFPDTFITIPIFLPFLLVTGLLCVVPILLCESRRSTCIAQFLYSHAAGNAENYINGAQQQCTTCYSDTRCCGMKYDRPPVLILYHCVSSSAKMTNDQAMSIFICSS